MSTQVQWRGGTSAENDAFTGASREITVDTTNKELRVHDGVTAGGFAAARKSALAAHTSATGNVHGLTKADIGLGNVNNTADADKPVSIAQAAAIAAVESAADSRLDVLEANKFTKVDRGASGTLAVNEHAVVLASAISLTLPPTPAFDTRVRVSTGAFANTIILRNGQNFQGVADDVTLDVAGQTYEFVFVDATRGWQVL